jgi:DNA polymerase elongation subunit (family B)
MSVFYTSVDRTGNFILFRGYKNKKPISKKIEFQPTVFLPTQEFSEWKTIDGIPVAPFKPGTTKKTIEFVDQYKDVENFKIYGNQNFIQQFISDNFLDNCPWDRSIIDVASIDIEVQSDNGFPEPNEALYPVTAITLRSSTDNIYYCWGLGDYDSSKTINKDVVIRYVKCNSEQHLLKLFMQHWVAKYPDVLTGWNSRLFDTVYLINRIASQLGKQTANLFSPWGITREKEINSNGRTHQVYEVLGIQQLDYLDLFKKFGYTYGTQENNRLDTIAYVVLGERKISYEDYGNLYTLYKENHQLFIDYNIFDVQLVDKLEDKMGLITLCMSISYRGLVNMAEAFGPVNLWDSLIYNDLRRKKIVVPPKKIQEKNGNIKGAYVKEPNPGLYEWVCSFDLNSLYPHLIMQYNMSPETVIDKRIENVTVDSLIDRKHYDIPEGTCMAATGQLFDTKKEGFIPKIIEQMYEDRATYKKQALKLKQEKEKEKDKNNIIDLEKQINRLDNQQMAIKILMNSFYGALSNEYFRFFDDRIAESITVSGQLSIRWAEKTINTYINKILKTNSVDYVIGIDTDSCYIDFKPFVSQVIDGEKSKLEVVSFLDEVCSKKIEPLLSKSYQQLSEYMNAPKQKMVMKREVIADKGIWTGKKHYILNVYNNEGVQYTEPKLKMVGIEAVRSSTPMACRQMIMDTIKIIINSDERTVQNYIQELKKEFFALPPEKVAFPRGVNNLNKYFDKNNIYAKSCPINARAALLYNNMIEKLELTKKYETINSGEKIKFCYLRLPNPIRENVIGFINTIPPEFKVNSFIDYDLQFEKALVEPLKTILNAIGWSVEARITLERFFSK